MPAIITLAVSKKTNRDFLHQILDNEGASVYVLRTTAPALLIELPIPEATSDSEAESLRASMQTVLDHYFS